MIFVLTSIKTLSETWGHQVGSKSLTYKLFIPPMIYSLMREITKIKPRINTKTAEVVYIVKSVN